MSNAIKALEKAEMKKLLSADNLPEWTSSQSPIKEPLSFPEETAETPLRKNAPCLLCHQEFSLPEKQPELLAHLLESHRLIISDVHLVANLAEYLAYWKKKLVSTPICEFASTVKASVTEKGLEAKKNNVEEKEFFMLSDVLTEDKELRLHLQRKLLEDVLRQQQREREDKTFKRGCLFCRTEFEGWYGHLLNHLQKNHNFNVGHPDNLVFVSQLLDMLEEKVESCTCVFCEKIFPSRNVLKEHMRKKQHKTINPKNKAYDKFYVVNYREFGRGWGARKEFMRGSFDDEELPNGFNSDEGEDDVNWDEWQGDPSGAVCLFCPAKYVDICNLMTHMTSIHDFDFQHIRNKKKLDFYQQVKLINFIRRKVHLKECIVCSRKCQDSEDLVEHMTVENHLDVPKDDVDWDQPDYLFPVYENDYLLCRLDDIYESQEKVPVESEDVSANASDSILSDEAFRRSIFSTALVLGRPRSRQDSRTES